MLIPESVIPADRYGVVYVVTNRVNGKQYVGQTVRPLTKRWKGHRNRSTKGTSVMSNAIAKYGRDAFQMEAIDWAFSQEMLDHKERFWIAFLDTIAPEGYNLKDGGNGGGHPHPDTVAKMSALKRGRHLPDGHPFKQKGRKPWTRNDPKTKEQKAKISATLKRRYAEGYVHPMLGHKHTEEARARIRATSCQERPWRRKPIRCVETNQVFDSAVAASLWLRENKGLRASRAALNRVIKAGNGTVGTYHWQRANKEEITP